MWWRLALFVHGKGGDLGKIRNASANRGAAIDPDLDLRSALFRLPTSAEPRRLAPCRSRETPFSLSSRGFFEEIERLHEIWEETT